MANRPASHYPDIGVLGEDIVAQWLQETGWIILHRRWRCRWGELDLVARLDPHQDSDLRIQHSEFSIQKTHSPLLAFVEVKTRSKGNWDAGGLLAITPQKQAKLWQAARYFLSAYPDFADYPCRFDVALVSYQKAKYQHQPKTEFIEPASDLSLPIQLGRPIKFAGYQLLLQEYLPSAFD